MTNAEAERLDLHIGLKKVLGDDMADKLMSHLPPTGWSDIARRSEMLARFDLVDQRFEAMERRFDAIDRRFELIDRRFEDIDRRFEEIDRRFDQLERRIDRLENRIKFLIGGMIPVVAAILVMFVQLNMSIAALR